MKKKKEKRRINKSEQERCVHVYYDHPVDKKFTSFSKYVEKEFGGSLEEHFAKR